MDVVREGYERSPFHHRVSSFTAQMDEDYLVVVNHIDQLTQEKIQSGEYVDFSKLISKDKILLEEDGRLELVIRNGKTFWSPVSETVTISNFVRWEQAFRVYSNIYTRKFPEKVGDLIQYNHVIHSISLTYTWENVYSYDKEFRLHMSKHPARSWAVILQQAWSMRLKDRLSGSGSTYPGNGQKVDASVTKTKVSDECKRYNRGHCSYGSSCKFDHKCSFCGKFGHPVITCRKLMRAKEKRSSGGGTRRDDHHTHAGHVSSGNSNNNNNNYRKQNK